MAEMKTKANVASVDAFLGAVEPAAKRADCEAVCAMMARLSGKEPMMWGPAIVGFGSYHYKYDSGREGEMCRIGFSPRAAQITLYVGGGFIDHRDRLARLGKHSTGKGCLYLKKLADVDESVLAEIIQGAIDAMDERYPA